MNPTMNPFSLCHFFHYCADGLSFQRCLVLIIVFVIDDTKSLVWEKDEDDESV